MQKILPMMSVLGVCGEVKGHVAVVWVDVGTVWVTWGQCGAQHMRGM